MMMKLMTFMGAKWDVPNCAWDGKQCIQPIQPKMKAAPVPIMNVRFCFGMVMELPEVPQFVWTFKLMSLVADCGNKNVTLR
mmetsp:Transcript_10988/g.22101  ORF Transcript_10988/g.22101 Transcript_10988/m.22101 type:complete len:81 (+) Transcript_10988:53-295(+)